MQTNLTVDQVIETINREAAANCNDDIAVGKLPIGEGIRQGDLYLERISELPKGAKLTSVRQLAPGSTKGSRHVAAGNVQVYNLANPTPLQGPVVVAGAPWSLEHPEHANFTDIPSGVYASTYQRDLRQEEIARVRD